MFRNRHAYIFQTCCVVVGSSGASLQLSAVLLNNASRPPRSQSPETQRLRSSSAAVASEANAEVSCQSDEIQDKRSEWTLLANATTIAITIQFG